MTKPNRWFHRRHRRPKTCLVALGAMACLGSALAQPVLITPPISLPSTSSGTESGNADESSGDSSGDSGIVPLGGLALKWRKLTFRPHVSYQVVYGTGIQSRPNDSQKTFIQTVTPGVAIDIGTHWLFDYTPSFVFYSDPSFNDAWNNAMSLMGHTSYDDWDYALKLGLDFSNNPQTETGQQTDEKNYTGSVSASHQLNSNLSLDLSASASLHSANSFNSSRNYSTLNWLNQQYGPNLGFGVGLGFGYEDVETGSDMTYEQVQARVVWHITGQRGVGRLDFSINGGPEFRQFLDSNESAQINPIFGGSLLYQIFEPTTLSLNASHSTSSSYYDNQITETTRVNATLNQRLFQYYSLGVSGGYTFTDYQSTGGGASPNRSDNTPFFSASLGRSFLKRGSISVFYSWTKNASDGGGYSYNSEQVGCNISYAY